MSTPDLNAINSEPQFASVSALAAMLGVDKAAVSRKVARYEQQGLVETRAGGNGRPKLVHVAAYLAAAEQTTDAIRAANGVQARAPEPADPSLAQEQRRRIAIQADLAQIDLDRARGGLVPAAEVREAMARAAGEIVRTLETLPGRADDLGATFLQGGVAAGRAALREFVRELRERLAAEMTLLATETAGDGEE